MITHVAIRYAGKIYSLPATARHHHVLAEIEKEHPGLSYDPQDDDEGFLTSDGVYLTREEAVDYAIQAGQISDRIKVYGDMLFSEDLW